MANDIFVDLETGFEVGFGFEAEFEVTLAEFEVTLAEFEFRVAEFEVTLVDPFLKVSEDTEGGGCVGGGGGGGLSTARLRRLP
jgi:hypothetical protein